MNYSNTDKKFNRQYATSYIAYMMIGSYFHAAKAISRSEEKHLLLHYREMPHQQQLKKEELICKKMDSFGEGLRKKLSRMNAEVRFSKYCGFYFVSFYTGFEGICCVIDQEGNILFHTGKGAGVI